MLDKQTTSSRRLPDPSLWVDQYGDDLFRYALLRLRQRDLAEDLVQETFLAALHARDQFAGQSSAKSWLIGILKHKIVDTIRRRNRQVPASDISASGEFLNHLFDRRGKWRINLVAWNDEPSAILEQKEFWTIFYRCLAKLPTRLADAFALWEIEGLSSKQVRQALHVSAGNLWVLLHRARLQLWRCLDLNWFGNAAGKG